MSDKEIDFSRIKPELLTKENYSPSFNCTNGDTMGLNVFYHSEALDYQRVRLGITYVFLYEGKALGFVTVSMSKISRELLEEEDQLGFRQRDYPAMLIGRLAVDNNWRKRGIGTMICKWCIGFAIEMSNRIGCRYVVLQTDDDHAGWYQGEKRGFKIMDISEKRNGTKDYWLFKKIEIF